MYKRTNILKIKQELGIKQPRKRGVYVTLICKCGCNREFKVLEDVADKGRKYYDRGCYLKNLKKI